MSGPVDTCYVPDKYMYIHERECGEGLNDEGFQGVLGDKGA